VKKGKKKKTLKKRSTMAVDSIEETTEENTADEAVVTPRRNKSRAISSHSVE